MLASKFHLCCPEYLRSRAVNINRLIELGGLTYVVIEELYR